ncbi:MAG: ATP-dependent DNA ligase [Aciduliprofundum sp.]|nr:MAG: ATP-dependent DNA ligase [Aciduliprofundum sp.]
MKYRVLADTYQRIEETSKRLEMTDYLVELLRKTEKEELDKVIYLTQGKIYPDYVGIELGMADKMAIRAISLAYGVRTEKVEERYQKLGDLGLTAEEFAKNKMQKTLFTFEEKGEGLTIGKVFENFRKIAEITGERSQDKKIQLLEELLNMAEPIESRYIVRTVSGKLRLGIADATILDAMAIAFSESKENREEIERAYNIHPDLGFIAIKLANEGINGIRSIKVTPGVPVRSMLAERLPTLDEILEKMGGRCAFEYKYDGLRIQAHYTKEKKLIFSRRLENLTSQFPDIIEGLESALGDNEAILDGEGVPVNVETGELLPFQAVSHRRGRKYDVEKAIEEYPVVLFLFDILYLNGEDLTMKPYPRRREMLEKIIKETDKVKLATRIVSDDKQEISRFFEKAIESGCEGLVAKSISDESIYRAGAREFLWIKFKRDYQMELSDTVDLVVVGAFAGHGLRTGTYGALLMAAYDEEKDAFVTVCKLGSGFTEDHLKQLPKILDPYKINHRHPRVISNIEADFWFSPYVVLELIGAELTLSPSHTCCMDVVEKGSGISMRFPRFTGRFRTDKKPDEATTAKEILELYRSQKKKLITES